MESQKNVNKIEYAKEVIEKILNLMELEITIDNITSKENIEVLLSGNDAGFLIGKKGNTMEAFQFLINKIVNRFPEDRYYVVLDIEGYRKKQTESLIQMAKIFADKARKSGKIITLDPMPAYKRKIIHTILSDFEGIQTESFGDGEEKKIKIIPSKWNRT